ncbi:MAG: DEAD/DEAH box helicase [Erysipelotrichaceae bacterium]
MKFSEFNLSPKLLHAIEDLGYTETTYIQEMCIPLVLDGKDIIGQSQTGTGKTAAFGLPLLERLTKTENRRPQVLILTPTRELTQQITLEMRKYAQYMEGVKIVAIYGGEAITGQIRDLKGGVDIIVGTPGRVMDHMERKTLRFNELKTIVLDEADEMLKLGFKEAIEEILPQLPEDRQTLLFSATMPQTILDIVEDYQQDPIHIKSKQKELTVNLITQLVYTTNQSDKMTVLVQLLEYHRPESCMIFCNTKKMVDDVQSLLQLKGYNASSIHGDLKQEMRSIVMNKFKQKQISYLICTDVAARGIDIDHLDMVINYDIPQELEYYVHRIGRTGRAGKEGVSVTLVTPRQKDYLRQIERITKVPLIHKPLPSNEDIQAVYFKHMEEEILAILKTSVPSEIKRIVADLVTSGINPIELAEAALAQHINKDIFAQTKAPVDASRRAKRITNATILLDVGKRHNVAAAHIVSAVAESSGISGQDIGKIRIQETTTTVEVPEEFLPEILTALNLISIKGYKIRATETKKAFEDHSKKPYQKSRNFEKRHY